MPLGLTPASCVPEGKAEAPSLEPACSGGSQHGVCTAFLFQMYIALISLHALIMVGFHFLHCFEDDWTSEYMPVLASVPQGGCVTRDNGDQLLLAVP